jgi:hypothetical protein
MWAVYDIRIRHGLAECIVGHGSERNTCETSGQNVLDATKRAVQSIMDGDLDLNVERNALTCENYTSTFSTDVTQHHTSIT